MRQPFLYLDRGHGWENLTGHAGSVAMLAAFDIDWGTDTPTKQPDVSVAHFKLLDRTGHLAGNSTALAGAKVLIQLTRMPQWSDLNSTTAWQRQDRNMTWASFHRTHTPTLSAQPDPTALTIFRGTMATGNTVTQQDDGTWQLDLHANSNLVRATRTTEQGPTSTDPALKGMHWTGTPAQRLAEIQRRLTKLGSPPLASSTIIWLNTYVTALAPYPSDSFPDLTTVLYHHAGHAQGMPLYYETHSHSDGDRLEAWMAGDPASITLHADGTLSAETSSCSQPVLSGDLIQVDAHTLTLPDPVSQVIIKGKAATFNDTTNTIGFEDAQITIGDRGRLPSNLTETVSSAVFESDVVIEDRSDGHWKGGIWSPGDAVRGRWADWLKAATMRLRPDKLTVTSHNIDIDTHEQTLQPAPSLYAFIHNRYTPLLSDDGTPATSGVWLAIGGTLSFDWKRDEPVLSNELTLWPMPTVPPTLSAWNDLKPIGLPWSRLAFTWGEFGQITHFKN